MANPGKFDVGRGVKQGEEREWERSVGIAGHALWRPIVCPARSQEFTAPEMNR